jgi:hypothetical protein
MLNMKSRNPLIRTKETVKLKNMKIEFKNLEEKLLRSESEYAKEKLSNIDIQNLKSKIAKSDADNLNITFLLIGFLVGKIF